MNDRSLHPPESRSPPAELRSGEHRDYHHPEAGAFCVRRFFGPHPDGLPFFTSGRFYATEALAVAGFYAACAAPDDAPADSRRVADRIDGYDRDDLRESPDR